MERFIELIAEVLEVDPSSANTRKGITSPI